MYGKKKYAKQNDTKTVSISHDHILFYARNVAEWVPGKIERTNDQLKGFRNPDSDSRGVWQSVVYTCNKTRTQRPNLYYPIINPITGEEAMPDENRVWGFDRAKTERNIREKRLWWGENGELAKPRLKSFLGEVGTGVVPDTLWLRSDVGDNQDAAREILALFGIPIFDTPKPTTLLSRCLTVANCKVDDIVVDFFAGSASLAHACFKLSCEGHQHLKWVSIQLPEPVEHNGFKTIADIAKERLRRAGSKIRAEWEEKNATLDAAKARSEEKKAGDLFAESAKSAASSASNPQSPIPNLPPTSPPDTGFRVFKLAPSNFKRWDGEAAAVSKVALEQQLEASLDHIATGATEESILFEILLKAGYPLTCPLEKLELAGHTVYAIDGNSLFICVADRINKELINAVAEKHPVQFICLDRALQGNDPLKVNTLESFRAAQPEIQFRTV